MTTASAHVATPRQVYEIVREYVEIPETAVWFWIEWQKPHDGCVIEYREHGEDSGHIELVAGRADTLYNALSAHFTLPVCASHVFVRVERGNAVEVHSRGYLVAK